MIRIKINYQRTGLYGMMLALLCMVGCTSASKVTSIAPEYRTMRLVHDTTTVYTIDYTEHKAIPARVLRKKAGESIDVIGIAEVQRGSKPIRYFALMLENSDTIGITIGSYSFCALYAKRNIEEIDVELLEDMLGYAAICRDSYDDARRVRTISQQPTSFTLPRTSDSIAWARAADFIDRHKGEGIPLTLGNVLSGALSSDEIASDTLLQSGPRKNSFIISRAVVGDSATYRVTCFTDYRNAESKKNRLKYEEILARRCSYYLATGKE